MFDNFEPISVTTQTSPVEVTIRGLRSKPPSPEATTALPPLLLLHGFPQTLHIWHRVAPQLTAHFTVILIDLRGYGASSKPTGTGTGTSADAADNDGTAHYAKSAMARDCIAVMAHLFPGTPGTPATSFYLAAHDRGARVAHKLCVDYPAQVKAALLLDICPTLAMYAATDVRFASAYWHWFFLIQRAPLPESMILGAGARAVADMFMGGGGAAGIFAPECWEAYVGALGDAATVHGMCQDYRAAATLDLDEQRADAAAGRRIRCPLTVLWGRHGVVDKCFDALGEWRKVTDEGVRVEGRAVESGHYIPEQAPDEVVSAIRNFLV